MLLQAVTSTFDHLTLNVCSQVIKLCQISGKQNNPLPSYSDLKIENLATVRHLGFDRK